MGMILSKAFRRKRIPVIIVGLDSAGKTTIVNKLKLNNVTKTIPTIGFNVETFQYRDIDFTLWDLGGQIKLRKLWRFYCRNIYAIIFVIDASDHDRILEATNELHNLLLNCELENAILLIFANKQDIQNVMKTAELTDKLQLNKITNRRWYVQKTCAIQGKGLYEGFYWIVNELNSMATKTSSSTVPNINLCQNPLIKKMTIKI